MLNFIYVDTQTHITMLNNPKKVNLNSEVDNKWQTVT
jgi:hypothetical protein